MNSNSSPNVIFAVIIGTAIILGAVTLNSVTDRFAGFGTSVQQPTPDTLPDIQASTLREPVEHSDEDSQDAWRQTLLTRDTPRIMIPGEATDVASYTPPDTTTNRFSVSLLKPMIQVVSGEIDETTADMVFSDIIDETLDETLPDLYQIDDLTTFASNNRNDLKEYFNTLGDIFIKHAPRGGAPTIELFEQIISDNDQAARAELSVRQNAYSAMVTDIANVPVPRSQVRNHVRFLNTIHILQNDFQHILSYHEDMLPGHTAYTRYVAITDTLFDAMQKIGLAAIQHADLYDDPEGKDSAFLFIDMLPLPVDLN